MLLRSANKKIKKKIIYNSSVLLLNFRARILSRHCKAKMKIWLSASLFLVYFINFQKSFRFVDAVFIYFQWICCISFNNFFLFLLWILQYLIYVFFVHFFCHFLQILFIFQMTFLISESKSDLDHLLKWIIRTAFWITCCKVSVIIFICCFIVLKVVTVN